MGDDAPAEPQSKSPAKGVLALLSLSVFVGLIVLGGVIGLLSGGGQSSPTLASASSVVPEPEPTTAAVPTPTTAVAAAPTSEVAAEVTEAPDDGDAPKAPVEVLGVTELGLPLGTFSTETTTPSTVSGDTTNPADIEIIELPKAVYDSFTLEPNELLVVNIAANDKIGGRLDSVVSTGVGSLPPGFTLDNSGLLSGSTGECGNWRLQYALLSTNPAIGTSWIDITVEGCPQ